jgi:hypothetical protein
LTSDSAEIRLASVSCCARIIKPFIKVYEIAGNPQKTEVYSLISSVLECLIKTAVVDPEVSSTIYDFKELHNIGSNNRWKFD